MIASSAAVAASDASPSVTTPSASSPPRKSPSAVSSKPLMLGAGILAVAIVGILGFRQVQLSQDAAQKRTQMEAEAKEKAESEAMQRAAAAAALQKEVEERKQRELEASTPAIADSTNSLSQAEKTALQDSITRLRNANGIQVYIHFTGSLYGEDIRAFSFKQLKSRLEYGTALNGVIFLTATEDRKTSIQVSDQLRVTLSDEVLSQIWLEMAPLFEQTKYYDGLTLGIQQVVRLIEASKGIAQPNTK